MAKRAPIINIYATLASDPRAVGTYSVGTAASYLRLPVSTLRSWTMGTLRKGPTGRRHAVNTALIIPDERHPTTLSFWNLVEAQVLASIRKVHGVNMSTVRRSLATVTKVLGHDRPLIHADFQTDGVTLFVKSMGELVDVGARGGPQLALTKLLEGALARIKRDENGIASRLSPWVVAPTEPHVITLDPLRSFGRPILTGTRIPAEVIIDRFAAGETIDALARDFGIASDRVEYAVRWGTRRVGAA